MQGIDDTEMEEVGIEDARRQLGEIVGRADLAGQETLITRNGKPAAVIVSAWWYGSVAAFIRREYEEMEAYNAWQERDAAMRKARRAARLRPGDKRTVHHIDGNPRNNDPSNLQIVDPEENQP